MTKQQAYEDKIRRMLIEYRAWLAAHPDTKVLISFRIPPKVFVAAGLDHALRDGFVVVDYHGKRMLKELGWLENISDIPSVAQAQAVIEHVHNGRSLSQDPQA